VCVCDYLFVCFLYCQGGAGEGGYPVTRDVLLTSETDVNVIMPGVSTPSFINESVPSGTTAICLMLLLLVLLLLLLFCYIYNCTAITTTTTVTSI